MFKKREVEVDTRYDSQDLDAVVSRRVRQTGRKFLKGV